MSDIEQQGLANKPRNRRAVVKGAAWSVPVIAAAIAAPAASASELGALSINGTCGTLGLGVLSAGFNLVASPTAPIPAGTVITLVGTGLANISAFAFSGAVATVDVLSGTTQTVTLDSAVPAGGIFSLTNSLSLAALWTVTATVTLPAGDTATGAKTTAQLNGTLVLCSAS